MAYDWSGNTVKQKRDDWVVIIAIAAMALFAATMPLVLVKTAPSTKLIETTSIAAPAAVKM
ncbi:MULTISPECIES: hypothetical protein [Rhizobium/Agrobacterium group]|uniref:hypothetical protein n=1 Tax=Rhizobium/Agrobacterium group TaxID=227290 RepID=UPI000712A2F7|nr:MULTISPECIES: hypothetical protein [Rhizobium/Agrobacterium group]KQQ61032.1 hypothetical protein ASF69_00910 [Rhizobium sp. Leaf311]